MKYTLLAILAVALIGCNSHPSIIPLGGHGGNKGKASTSTPPVIEPTCPVCSKPYKGKGKGKAKGHCKDNHKPPKAKG